MAAPAQLNRRETVEFPPNVPVQIALAYPEPRLVHGPFGERAMFTTTDNRVVFLDLPVAGRITELGINVREKFTLTRKPAEPEACRTTGKSREFRGSSPTAHWSSRRTRQLRRNRRSGRARQRAA